MPYITKDKRQAIDNICNDLFESLLKSPVINTSGDLNYIISSIIDKFIQKQGKNYNNLNNVIGVLECVKQEYYRRVVVPYEETKIEENGDIFNEETLSSSHTNIKKYKQI